MGIYIAYGTLIPLTVVLLYLIYKYIVDIRHEYLLKKNVEKKHLKIDHKNFTKLSLDEIVEADYRMPKGQWAHFIFDLPYLYEGAKARKYVGNTLSNIRLPFVSLSMQNREFRDESDFYNKGPAIVTFTNKILRVQTHKSDQSLRREFKWANIEQVKFVTDDKTIQVSMTRNAWPLRFTLNSHEEAIKFINAIWTMVDKYTRVNLEESGKAPDEDVEITFVTKPEKKKTTKKKKTKEVVTVDEETGMIIRETVDVGEPKKTTSKKKGGN